jgi:hypothetical protein
MKIVTSRCDGRHITPLLPSLYIQVVLVPEWLALAVSSFFPMQIAGTVSFDNSLRGPLWRILAGVSRKVSVKGGIP